MGWEPVRIDIITLKIRSVKQAYNHTPSESVIYTKVQMENKVTT